MQRNLVRASTTKRAQSRRKTLEKMERLDKPLGDLKKAHFSFEIDRQSGNDVLDIHDLSIQFAQKSVPLFRNVTFRLEHGGECCADWSKRNRQIDASKSDCQRQARCCTRNHQMGNECEDRLLRSGAHRIKPFKHCT